jgi:NhaP-type Na+/H+ and K+/H+ antiporter
MQKTLAERHDAHVEHSATVQTGERQPFWGFTLNGSTSLEAVARFYGLKVPGLEAEITLGSYLGRHCYGILRPGHRMAVGGVELRILEVEEGRVTKVGLEFLPATLHPSRRRPHGEPQSIEPSVSRTASGLSEAADPPR